ncbi:MAG: hemerythrin domain-containing protein [Vicinamibacterales bacterium]
MTDTVPTMTLDEVLDRIVDGHHVYVRTQAPVVARALHRLLATTGDACPALPELTQTFERLADDLRHHMAKEELILFPAIRALIHAQEVGQRVPRQPFGTIGNPIHVMEREHEQAAADLRRIHELTAQVEAPGEADPAWRTCRAAIDDFARDLQAHVYLENHVLFPAAARLEEVLS